MDPLLFIIYVRIEYTDNNIRDNPGGERIEDNDTVTYDDL